MDKIFVKINLLWATVLTFLTSAFGAYWYIFAAFMVLNVVGASALLRRNLLIYGLGGIIAPFVGIKLIDLVIGLFF